MRVSLFFAVICFLTRADAGFAQANGVQTPNYGTQNLNINIRDYVKSRPRANVYESLSFGSPWLLSYWSPAFLTDLTGQKYWGAAFKVDLVADKVIFMDKGEELELVTPIQTMVVIDSLTRDSLKLVRPEYLKLNDENVRGWLQVYVTGEATLIHDLNKTMIESKVYGSSSKEYNVNDNFVWLIVLDGDVHRIKKLKEAEVLLSDKKPALRGFSYKQKGLGPQLQELVRAYNSQI